MTSDFLLPNQNILLAILFGAMKVLVGQGDALPTIFDFILQKAIMKIEPNRSLANLSDTLIISIFWKEVKKALKEVFIGL